MSDQQQLLASPKPAPDLQIPESSSTVEVRIIDPTTYGYAEASLVFTPKISGIDKFVFPSYVFLITNKTKNKHILFDLGQRKDWETALNPGLVGWIKQYMPFTVEKNVNEILDADTGSLGITSKDISSIIWSHHHFDHRGDISHFPNTTELVLGPGFLKTYAPGYPKDPKSSINEDELKAGPVRELSEQDMNLKIGGFPAHDFFSDGSLYILSSPGHTTGHVSALARVTSEPKSTFVFLGGDCTHHPAIFRPTEYLPLPAEVPAVPGSRFGMAACPGQMFVDYAHPQKSATQPFMKANTGVNEDQAQAEASVASMQKFDAHDDVLVIIAHDASLLLDGGHLDFYPKTLNDWHSQGKKGAARWNFCGEIDVKSAKQAAES